MAQTKWSIIAKSLPGRIGKQCRERWHNHLNPAIKKDAWTEAEEAALIRAHQVYGNKWAEIARFLPGRDDNSIKNHWNCSVKKKLCSYIASGLLGPIPCVAHNYHNALKGKCIIVCKHSGDSFLSCEQRGCLHGDASWLESKNQSASSSDKQRLSFTPPETHVSEFYERTVKLEKVERDMDNGSGVMCCPCTIRQEDENLSYESGGSLILKPNDTILLADADLGCLPKTLVSKPEQKASPSCLQRSHCSLSFSSTHLVEEKIPLKNSNSRSGNKKNVDITSSVPTRDSKIVEDPQPFIGKVMDESCYAIDSGTANVSSILHKNESCDPIPSGNFKDFYAPDQLRNLEFGQLCYNPINLTYWDVPLSKTLGSWNELEQNLVYPDPLTSTVNAYVRGGSPESILRNAARNLKNAPSILRKRRRETLRSLPSETIKTNSTRFGFNGMPEVRC